MELLIHKRSNKLLISNEAWIKTIWFSLIYRQLYYENYQLI